MTTNEPRRDVGYRGALPTRQDRLARPWILAVIAIFVLVIVLSILGVPSRFVPDPTPIPLPSIPAVSDTPSPSPSPTPSVSPSPSGSAGASGSASASPSATPAP
jgi:hypothetical protein